MAKPVILCVDDEMLVLTSLREALSEVLGDEYTIEIAESGEEALELISEAQTEFPLVISDQLMPGIKGDELLAKIHAVSPKTLTIMLTGQATPEAIGNAVNAAKLYRYISKPWDDTLLIGIIQEALNSYFQDTNLNEINTVLTKVNAKLEEKIAERTVALQYRVELEQLIGNISTEFINLALDEIDIAIQSALQRLGEFMQVDRSYLFQISTDGTYISNTHEWCATDISAQINRLQQRPIDAFPWAMEILNRFEVLYIPWIDDLPPSASIEKAEFITQEIKSVLCVPIIVQKKLFGFVGFDSVRQVKSWSEDNIQSLRVIGEIFAGAIQHQRTEEALRESETRFRQCFEDASIGMAIVGLTGQFLRVNRALCGIFGYSEAEILSYTFQQITYSEDLATNLEYLHQAVSGKIHQYQLEKRYIHKQGQIIWVLLNVSVVRDSAGNMLHLISQLQDISNRHEVELLKNEFISIVSHEIRTPLTAIRGSLGILEAGVLDNEPKTAKRMLQVALNSSERLARLVDDTLNLERLESGIQPVKTVCEVTYLLEQAVESVQALAIKTSVTILVKSLVAQVWAAPDAIIQALINLLSNAIKFSLNGSTVYLSAEIRHDDESSSDILFSIKDEGRGIPNDKLETIFGRFQQVDVSDARKGGTGLGLAICKSIIQQHNGQIWVESEMGKGSTFYFTLSIPS